MQPQQANYGAPAPLRPDYDFITNPQKPARRPSLGGGSMLKRALIVGIGLIVLIVGFAIVKSVVSGGGNQAALLNVAQDQQEIIHLTMAASQQQAISATNKNFVVTAQLVIGSQQSQLLSYTKKLKQKTSQKDLNLKVKASLDTQLTNAAAASTYDSTFQSIMQSQLTDYQVALKVAYRLTPGVNGRNLLTDQYTSASLLQQQLTAH